MRAHHVIIVAVAVTLIGFGVKLIFFTEPVAEAKVLSLKSMSMDISELHRNTKNPCRRSTICHSSFPTAIDRAIPTCPESGSLFFA
jgi:hypothetical protein